MNKALHIKEEWRGRFLHGTNPKEPAPLYMSDTKVQTTLSHPCLSTPSVLLIPLSDKSAGKRHRERKESKPALERAFGVAELSLGFCGERALLMTLFDVFSSGGKAVYPTPKRKRGLSNGPPSPLLTSAQRQQQHSLRLSLAPLFLLSSAFEVKNLPWRIQLFSALYLHVEMIRSLSKCKTIAIGCSCLCMSQKSSKACKGCAKTSDKQVKFLFKKC